MAVAPPPRAAAHTPRPHRGYDARVLVAAPSSTSRYEVQAARVTTV